MCSLYHQKQTLLSRNCGVYAVNNVLQRPQYSTRDFHELADSLHALGPMQGKGFNNFSTLIVGNFSIEVIVAALTLQACFVERFYIGGLDINDVNWNEEYWKGCRIMGVLVNKPWKIGDFNVGRHWLAICSINSNYVDLDSLIDQPAYIDSTSLPHYLQNIKTQSGSEPCYFFLVLKNVSEEYTDDP